MKAFPEFVLHGGLSLTVRRSNKLPGRQNTTQRAMGLQGKMLITTVSAGL